MAGRNPLPLAGEGREGAVVRFNVTEQHRAFARKLRREMTDAERLVWSRIRAHRLNGFSFRRQVPFLAYIADFMCHEAKLVIEIDGGQHNEDRHAARDAVCASAFARAGYRVLRFYNTEIFAVLESVIATIYHAALERTPDHLDHRSAASPPPSVGLRPLPPQAGEGSR